MSAWRTLFEVSSDKALICLTSPDNRVFSYVLNLFQTLEERMKSYSAIGYIKKKLHWDREEEDP